VAAALPDVDVLGGADELPELVGGAGALLDEVAPVGAAEAVGADEVGADELGADDVGGAWLGAGWVGGTGAGGVLSTGWLGVGDGAWLGAGDWGGVLLGAGVVVGPGTAGTTRVAPKNADHQTVAILTWSLVCGASTILLSPR
jgi:hypothetical protein